MTRLEQAIDGLDIEAHDGLVLINDGESRWMCVAEAWDRACYSLSCASAYPATDVEAEPKAYAELCREAWEQADIVVVSTGSSQGTPADRAVFLRRAYRAGFDTKGLS